MPMMRRLSVLAVLLMAALVCAPTAGAGTPRAGALYADGPSGRYLLSDGDWLFRLDPADRGIRDRYMRQTSTSGWSKVAVPSQWNLGDDTTASMQGGVGWYRKDFSLPSAKAALDWIVRFESVNYRTKVWLNGKPVGTNKGAYIPFEFRLANLKRRGTNRLVVRVDSVRRITDFPPSGLTRQGTPTGGWWNYSGILREVYLRKVDTVDWASVRVTPNLPCGTCDATVDVAVRLRSHTGSSKRVRVSGRFGEKALKFGEKTIDGRGIGGYSARIKVPNPRVWSPGSPNLYKVSLSATSGRQVASYSLSTGIRSVKISGDGRLLLNGQYTNIRGFGFHEDTKENGFAITNADREYLVGEAKALGATMMRTHYPPHPYLHELADRRGMLLWSEIPVYSNKTAVLKQPTVRKLAAKELSKNIEANANHPSVIIWSIGNELSPRPGPVQGYYIRAAAKLAKQLDPSRPVGLAVAGYPSAGCQPEYAPLDIIGINEYFGWYPGPSGQLFDRTKLSPYLDGVRQCYPDKAIFVTEFGAEANREGPVEEKGTWGFQQDFVNYHLAVHASKPWLSGSLYWALNEFRVRPGWDGGNPRPNSPIHQKALVTYDRKRKPAWTDVQRIFTSTQQFSAPAGRRSSARR
jgi:beta-glucuronidase